MHWLIDPPPTHDTAEAERNCISDQLFSTGRLDSDPLRKTIASQAAVMWYGAIHEKLNTIPTLFLHLEVDSIQPVVV